MKGLARALVILLSLVMMAGTALAAENSNQGVKSDFCNVEGYTLVTDLADVMTPEEETALESRLEEISKAHNIRVAVMTMHSMPERVLDIDGYAERLLFRFYRDLENNNGAILFVQVTGERKYAVRFDTNMMKIISQDAGYPYLVDEFLPDMKDDEYYDAYLAYANAVDHMATYYETEGEPYDPAVEFSYLGLLIGLLLSGGIGAIFVSYLEGNMSNVRGQAAATNYFDNDSFNLTKSTDKFTYTSRTVVHHERSERSSGGGGGGSSSSGGGSGSY